MNHHHMALASPYGLIINGDETFGDERFPVSDPATGEVLAHVPDASDEAIAAALDAAAAAQRAWAATPAPERAIILHRIAAQLDANCDRLATVMTLEQGKPLSEARGEISYAAGFFRWFAGEAERMYGMTIPSSSPGKRMLVLKQPLGVAALITPWNFPTAMLARKLAPALAAGCAVVAKPAEQTPLSALELGRLMRIAGVPDGVVNIVTVSDPERFGAAVFADKRVRKISFTGSTEVGKRLMELGAADLKRLSLELGGNAPLIVFGDADIEAAVAGAIASKFRNAGQTCVCANRIYVERSVYDAFAEAFTAAAAELAVGGGFTPQVAIGPLIDHAAFEKVADHVADAVAKGAEVLVGGAPADVHHGAERAFWQPTVLGNATAAMRITQEETFGPVAPLIPFESEDEVLAAANASEYGLAAYVFTRDLGRAWRMAEGLAYGIVGINDGVPSAPQAPFGGVKQSGFGREGGPTGIDEYTDTKYISLGLG